MSLTYPYPYSLMAQNIVPSKRVHEEEGTDQLAEQWRAVRKINYNLV